MTEKAEAGTDLAARAAGSGSRRAQMRPSGITARLLAVLSATVAVLSFVLAGENGQTFADLVQQNAVTPVLMGAVLAIVGAQVVAQDPRNTLAWLFCVQGQLQGWSAFGSQFAVHDPHSPFAGVAAFLGAYAWAPGLLIMLSLTIPLFPDGRPADRGWRILLGGGILVTAVGTLVWLVSDAPMRAEFPGFHNPLALPSGWEPLLTAAFLACAALAGILALGGGVATVVRAVRTTGRSRGQSVWLLTAFAVGVVGQALDAVAPVIPTVGWMLFGAALGAAMLRGGLYDGDRILNRTLLSTVITAAIAGLFGLGAGLAAGILGGAALGTVLAAVVVALAVDPVRRLVRRTVDQALFGDRRDPMEALERLGSRLSQTIAPDDALAAVAEAVTTALRLPAASIALEGEDAPAVTAGVMPANTAAIPLVHSGAQVGTPMVGLPGARRFLDPQDERLLTELARQASAAADAVRLDRELRRSRDAVLAARDAERHRIRRDLHDGLGPALAGVSLGIGAARASERDAATGELLDRLRVEVDAMLGEVKALIAELRPDALEHGGLDAAIRGRLAMLS